MDRLGMCMLRSMVVIHLWTRQLAKIAKDIPNAYKAKHMKGMGIIAGSTI